MRERGYTLLEIVVVIAVVGLLSAILTPMIVRHINDSKIARAKSEVQVIAAAIGNFMKDVGDFPSMGKNGQFKSVQTLISGVQVPSNSPFTGPNQDWFVYGGANRDTFDNHLMRNGPQGGGPRYPSSGEFQWRGPYCQSVGFDPWGRPYVCNVQSTFESSSSRKCYVLSAGPDGVFQTPFKTTENVVVQGDDVGALVHQR